MKEHVYNDGSIYRGEWKDGKRHGQGAWTRPDGMKYEGEWKDDKPSGYGTLTYPSGKKRTGLWEDGKFVGEKQPTASKDERIKELEKANQELNREIAYLKQQLAELEQHKPLPAHVGWDKEQVTPPPVKERPSEKPIREKPKRRWVWAVVLLVILLIVVIAVATRGDDEPVAIPDEPIEEVRIVEEAEPEPEPEPDRVTISAGTYIIGTDIEPGLYRSDGGIDYWERLSGLSGEFGDIIANDAMCPGAVYVEIKPEDEAFSFRGSGTFYKIDDDYMGEMKTSFGPGMYMVGKDIEPGRYRSETGAEYWARLSGFSGEFFDIITNDAMVEGAAIVEISSSDVGFESRGAEWEKID